MSCGRIPEMDDICAGDRLGRLLNRARDGEARTEHDHRAPTSPAAEKTVSVGQSQTEAAAALVPDEQYEVRR